MEGVSATDGDIVVSKKGSGDEGAGFDAVADDAVSAAMEVVYALDAK